MPVVATDHRTQLHQRPLGPRAMLQTWTDLLFLHWPADPDSVQALVPPQLTVEPFDGKAWIGVVPFEISRMRAPWLPVIPGLRKTLELNVRTYVQVDGKPGVYFFSLDAQHPLVVWGARRFFYLPYMRADMSYRRVGNEVQYASDRTHDREPEARLRARWVVGEPLPQSEPDSLPHFLTERYCLYTVDRERTFCGRIHHRPWPLRRAELLEYESSMLDGHGLVADPVDPVLYHVDRLETEVWPLQRIDRR